MTAHPRTTKNSRQRHTTLYPAYYHYTTFCPHWRCEFSLFTLASRNHKSIQRQVKTGVPQGGVLSPTLFHIHTADIPTPTAPVQVMLYADDITITSTHTSMSAARKYIQPYLHKVYDWTQHNNLIINPDKTTCTLFTPDPAEYNSNLGLNINNKALPMALHPKVLGLTLDPKLTYNAHIQI